MPGQLPAQETAQARVPNALMSSFTCARGVISLDSCHRNIMTAPRGFLTEKIVFFRKLPLPQTRRKTKTIYTLLRSSKQSYCANVSFDWKLHQESEPWHLLLTFRQRLPRTNLPDCVSILVQSLQTLKIVAGIYQQQLGEDILETNFCFQWVK